MYKGYHIQSTYCPWRNKGPKPDFNPKMDDYSFRSHFRLNRKLAIDVENMVYFINDIFFILLLCFI